MPAGLRSASLAGVLDPFLRYGIRPVVGAAVAVLVSVAPGMAASPLCSSEAVGTDADGGQDYEWISRVQVNQTNIAVPKTGYYDASGSSTASLDAGRSYPVEVDVHTDGTQYLEFVKIWLDLNQDETIDAGELVYDSGGVNVQTFKTFAGPLTVPETAYNGTMYGRLIMQFNASPALCGTYEYGTTVDFRVDISGGQDNPAAPQPAENVTAVAGNGEAVISFDPPSSGPSPVGYIVKSNPGDIEVEGTSSPITVPGLTNGTSYTFTVVSKIDGTTFSAPSAPSNAVTPGLVTISLSPPDGALASGTSGTAYGGATVTASGGTAPYAYTVAAGALPSGLALDTATGAISGTPDTAGNYNFTVTATDSNGASGSASYSLSVAAPAPIASNVTATVAANSTGNAITLSLTGGVAESVSVVSAPSHGTATASGTTITYTPTVGYSGSDSFTYTATNATGTSAAATVTITVKGPTLALSPAAGGLPAGTVGTAYSQAVSASGGTAPNSYAVSAGALPAGLMLDAATGAISGTPTEHGAFNLTVTATDAYGATGSAAYSLAIGDSVAPVANDGTATVAANSSANPIALSLGGGAATFVAVASAPSHGTATASGTTITYTPAAGYSGSDSFTYTASNATGTSAAATVTITVTAPTLALTPAAGALPAGTVGSAYSQAVSASEGTGPYSYAVSSGALPAGISLNAATGVIAGTPTTAGNYSFAVTARDAYAATGSVSYSVAVSAPPAVFVFAPSGGPLTEAMAGEDYTQQISASGGSGALIYSLASGTLPRGMVLNISTGELTGPLAADAEGEYSFTIEVRDGNGATGTASFTLKVNPRAVTVTDKVVDVPAGSTPNNVYLNGGATGGPFISADLTFVEPANAGTATITRGQLAQAGPVVTPTGWYLQFKPNPAYSGQVRVGFRLTGALGVSNTGTVIYNIGYSAADVVQEIDSLAQGFVQRRQSMISSAIEVPGLLERRRMASANNPVTARISPSADGLALGFASSLVQMDAARDNADGASDAASSPFNIWVDGALLAHSNEENGGKWGSFAMVSLGADYLLSEKALLGLSIHYDRMADPTDEDANLTGNGWLAGPYASFEIGKNLFWDTSLLYGGSSNDIETPFWDGSFDTRRWLFDSSLEGQWQLDDVTVLTPRLRAVYLSEKAEDYSVQNGAGDVIELEGFTQEQLRVSLGAEIARTFELENGTLLTPKLEVNGGFSGLDGSGAFGSVSTGVSLQTVDDWTVDAGLLFNIEGEGEKSVGAKMGVSTRF